VNGPDAAFTLVELMVVVLVLSVLLAIAVPTFLHSRDRATDRSAQANLQLAARAASAGLAAGGATGSLDAAVIAAEAGLLTVDGAIASDRPGVVSVRADGSGWSGAVKGSGDRCWWVTVDTTGVQRFGTATNAWACTGAAAVGASAPSFDEAASRPNLALVSVGFDGSAADGPSAGAAPSADGRLVVFDSTASNLVPGDTNGAADVFVRDLATGVTTLASVSSAGAQGNAASQQAGISADGRYVAFRSTATNLVAGDTNGVEDVFVRDLVAGTTTRVSVGPGGVQATASSQTNHAAISPSGRYVQFRSGASNLVPGDTNGVADIFVHDRQTSTTIRVSVSSSGAQLTTASTSSVQVGDRFARFGSAEVVVPGDTNGLVDTFAYDLTDGSVSRLSYVGTGPEPNAAPTAGQQTEDGSIWTFQSTATNLDAADTSSVADVFVRIGSSVELLSRTMGGSGLDLPASNHWLAAGGSRVVFVSSSSQLTVGDPGGADVFEVLLGSRAISRLDLTAGAAELDGVVSNPRLDASGTVMAFQSTATNHLAVADANGPVEDVFVLVR
jgi:TolB protein